MCVLVSGRVARGNFESDPKRLQRGGCLVALFLQGNCLALCGGENYCGPFDILPRHKGKLIQTIQKTLSRARFVPSLLNKKEKQPNNVVGRAHKRYES